MSWPGRRRAPCSWSETIGWGDPEALDPWATGIGPGRSFALEERLPQRRIGEEVRARSLGDDAPTVQEVRAVGETEEDAHVLAGGEDSHVAAVRDLAQRRAHAHDEGRGQPEERVIDEE